MIDNGQIKTTLAELLGPIKRRQSQLGSRPHLGAASAWKMVMVGF
jgi:hypothetical protein